MLPKTFYWLGRISRSNGTFEPGMSVKLKTWWFVYLCGVLFMCVKGNVPWLCILVKYPLCDNVDEYRLCRGTEKEKKRLSRFLFCLSLSCHHIINLPGLPVCRGHFQRLRGNLKGACFVLSGCVYLIYHRLPLFRSLPLISGPVGEEELDQGEKEGEEERARVVVFQM